MPKHEVEKVYFGTHSLDEIRELVGRMRCGKIDVDFALSIPTKEQLIEYLESKECPALTMLMHKYIFLE